MLKAVPRQLDSLALLVELVREFLGTSPGSAQMAFDLDLVIEELFTNIVRHGRGSGSVEIELSPATPEGVRLVLRTDEPVAHDPTATPAVDTNMPAAQRSAGGLGVHFVRELSREFRYEWSDGVATTTVVVGAKL
jgi:serine/threonine-protein kinase RsbW